ncbi:serine hydrolase domain-containing protein [Flocculibacter collagenilyticus]|uniref:serine hydrolase domain-containing protein n=1 Tax=Flocculibacter collagenilyticus TaxID=2744479 RepID=UPI0018F50F60|nr:serine hydrolase domain-containing protein [Flocculibacter collagenilyticus]
MRFCGWLAVFLCSWSTYASPNNWTHFVDSYIHHVDTKIKSKNIPGAAVAVVNPKYSSVALGLGKTKMKGGNKVTANTRFRLASVSKTFAGSLASKLANNGSFLLHDPITKYVPDFKLGKYAEDLKVYHLLSHSSGLVPNAYDNLIESRMSYPDIVTKLMDVSPICEPGKCYGYQNVMFSLIGEVTQRSTGKPYETWIKETIFKPLNMQYASIGYQDMVKDDNYAHPHVQVRNRKWVTTKLKPNYYKVSPAAGVNASASDMVQWLKAQLGEYPHVLSDKTLQRQTTALTETKKELKRRVWKKKLKDAHYGLGWRIYDYDGEQVFYHSGWVEGYRADIVVLPRLNIGLSITINAGTGLINELTTEFLNRVIKKHRSGKFI